MSDAAPSQHGEILELAKLFLKLGTTAFGGPAAHMTDSHDVDFNGYFRVGYNF